MAEESIEERFKKAVWLIRNGPKMDSTNEQKLTFYSYFKQVGRHVSFCTQGRKSECYFVLCRLRGIICWFIGVINLPDICCWRIFNLSLDQTM